MFDIIQKVPAQTTIYLLDGHNFFEIWGQQVKRNQTRNKKVNYAINLLKFLPLPQFHHP